MSLRWEPNPGLRRGRRVVCTLHAHLVFTPKDRRGAFTEALLSRCEKIMRDVCADFRAELREFTSETDHVHLLVHYPPKLTLARLRCPGLWGEPPTAPDCGDGYQPNSRRPALLPAMTCAATENRLSTTCRS